MIGWKILSSQVEERETIAFMEGDVREFMITRNLKEDRANVGGGLHCSYKL